MRAGPKAIIGLGAPAALRAITLLKGGGVPPLLNFLLIAYAEGAL